MIKYLILFSLCLCTFSKTNPTIQTIDYVDLNKYLGRWYEIARYPTRFQSNNCRLVTAEYSLLENGRIKVVNTCWHSQFDGEIQSRANAKAWPSDDTNSKLKVRFFWPFTGDYWIVKLDKENYYYSVVSDPQMKYLWVLCREPKMESSVFDTIISFLDEKGFNTDKLIISPLHK